MLAQERRNSSALAMELRLSCTNPLKRSNDCHVFIIGIPIPGKMVFIWYIYWESIVSRWWHGNAFCITGPLWGECPANWQCRVWMFSWLLIWICCWIINHIASDFRYLIAHVISMQWRSKQYSTWSFIFFCPLPAVMTAICSLSSITKEAAECLKTSSKIECLITWQRIF